MTTTKIILTSIINIHESTNQPTGLFLTAWFSIFHTKNYALLPHHIRRFQCTSKAHKKKNLISCAYCSVHAIIWAIKCRIKHEWGMAIEQVRRREIIFNSQNHNHPIQRDWKRDLLLRILLLLCRPLNQKEKNVLVSSALQWVVIIEASIQNRGTLSFYPIWNIKFAIDVIRRIQKCCYVKNEKFTCDACCPNMTYSLFNVKQIAAPETSTSIHSYLLAVPTRKRATHLCYAKTKNAIAANPIFILQKYFSSRAMSSPCMGASK